MPFFHMVQNEISDRLKERLHYTLGKSSHNTTAMMYIRHCVTQ